MTYRTAGRDWGLTELTENGMNYKRAPTLVGKGHEQRSANYIPSIVFQPGMNKFVVNIKLKMEKLLRYTGKDIQNIQFDSWLEQKPRELRPLAIKWFAVIQKCGDDVQPIFHDGYPMGCVDNAPFAYVNVFKLHMNVGFFYGVELPDRVGLLEGVGKRMRHIKLLPDHPYDNNEIEALVFAAYADIKQRLKKR